MPGGPGSKEAFGSRGSIRASNKVIMDGGQGGQFAIAQAMQGMMVKRELPIAAFHTRTRPLKEVGTF